MGKGNNFWLDDPEWELLRRRAEKRPVSKQLRQRAQQASPRPKLPPLSPRAQTSKSIGDKEVTLNLKLTVPKVRLPDALRFYRQHRKIFVIMACTLAACVLALGTLRVVGSRGKSGAATDGAGVKSAEKQAQAEFNPLVPLATQPEFKYDSEKKVLGYMSDFQGVSMTISQQALPDSLKSGQTNILTIAQSIKADRSIDTQNGITYLATDQKTKTQTALFSAKDVLVFVRASKTLDDEDWRQYINQFNPSR